MNLLTSHATRLALGVTVSLATLGGGVASAATTVTDSGASQSARVATTASDRAALVAAAKPGFRAPFSCGQTWRGSAWTVSGGKKHTPQKSVDWNFGSGDADSGMAVRASAAGTVEFSGTSGGGYGQTIVIKHGTSGWKTRYAHLESRSVAKGASVAQGNLIGKVGKTGGQATTHLHYEQFTSTGVKDAVVQGVRFDPNDVHFIKSTNAC